MALGIEGRSLGKPLALACVVMQISIAHNSYAVEVPSSAEVDRQKPSQNNLPLPVKPESQLPATNQPVISAPEVAKSVELQLKAVNIEGATVFSEEELLDLYKEYIGKNVTLDVAWLIAGKITQKYNDAGYFLSRAYVPEQEVKDGTIIIKIVEGYIGKIELKNPEDNNYVIQALIDSFSTQEPVTAKQVESFLLRLNDLPGQSFKGVLSSMGSDDEAEAKMTLVSLESPNGFGYINLDNYGSRYLGPTQASASYKTSFLPLNQTNLLISSSLPFDEVINGSLEHLITISPSSKIGVNLDRTNAAPGYTLKMFEIESRATSAGLNFYYQAIRQRQENLSFSFGIDGKNTNTTLLDNQISHDQVRALRASATYDFFDDWDGGNAISVRLSQGIDALGSSKAGDDNLTRENAKPNFRKVELNLQRQQLLSEDFMLIASSQMQKSSGTLYSSEQFGYGGQNYGRAYDSSEIVGDHGISGSIEIRYNLGEILNSASLTPYGFYDIGKVWTEAPDASTPKDISGSSLGFGTRFEAGGGLLGNLGIAFPLTKEVNTPIYSKGKSSPRFLLQVSKVF